MKLILQILFLFLTWFANIVNALPVFTKVAVPNYELTFSKTENVKVESVAKIGMQNFARSSIENENRFSSISKGEVWASVTHSKEQENVVNGAGNWSAFSKIKMKITSIDADGWLMGKYVNGELQVVGNTNIAQKWDYIVKADGQILVGRKHSWLSQGEDVLAAGELKYNNGKLLEISNASGHYLPSNS